MGVERMTHLVFFCLITAVRMRRRKEYQGQLGQIQQEEKQKGELLGMLGEVFKWRGMSREINRFSYSSSGNNFRWYSGYLTKHHQLLMIRSGMMLERQLESCLIAEYDQRFQDQLLMCQQMRMGGV